MPHKTNHAQPVLTEQLVLDLFDDTEADDIEFDCTNDVITVSLDVNDDFFITISFDTDERVIDDSTILYQDTKYKGALLESQYVGEPSQVLDLDLSKMVIALESFICCDLNNGVEYFTDGREAREALDNERAYNKSPAAYYGHSQSDFA